MTKEELRKCIERHETHFRYGAGCIEDPRGRKCTDRIMIAISDYQKHQEEDRVKDLQTMMDIEKRRSDDAETEVSYKRGKYAGLREAIEIITKEDNG